MGKMLTHFARHLEGSRGGGGRGGGSVSFIEFELMKGGGASKNRQNNQTAYNRCFWRCWLRARPSQVTPCSHSVAVNFQFQRKWAQRDPSFLVTSFAIFQRRLWFFEKVVSIHQALPYLMTKTIFVFFSDIKWSDRFLLHGRTLYMLMHSLS